MAKAKTKYNPTGVADRRQRAKSYRRTRKRILSTLNALTADSVTAIRAISDEEWARAKEREAPVL